MADCVSPETSRLHRPGSVCLCSRLMSRLSHGAWPEQLKRMLLALMNAQDSKRAGMDLLGNNHSKAQHSHLSTIYLRGLGASDAEQMGGSHFHWTQEAGGKLGFRWTVCIREQSFLDKLDTVT